jgi:hypothetical protein
MTAPTPRGRRIISTALLAATVAAAAIGGSTVAYPAVAGATSCAGNQFPIYDKDGKFIGCGTITPRPQTPVFKTGRFT